MYKKKVISIMLVVAVFFSVSAPAYADILDEENNSKYNDEVEVTSIGGADIVLMIGGVVIAYIVDGVVIYITGESPSVHVANFIENEIAPMFDNSISGFYSRYYFAPDGTLIIVRTFNSAGGKFNKISDY